MRISSLLCFGLLAAACTRTPSPVPPPAPVPTAQPPASDLPAKPATPAARFAAARSWCLYYGPATPDSVDRLGKYEIVVIDPAALGATAKETIAALHTRGCLVAGYLSMIEVASWHRYRDRIPREWYLIADGKPWVPWAGKDVGWDANLSASLAEPGWRKMLVDLVQSEVLDYGCDGVFMDTLEDLDFAGLPAEERPRQLDGLRQLLAALDERYPEAFFIANRTLQGTLPVAAQYVDAICWEDFSTKYFDDPEVRPWMEGIAKNIAAEAAKRPADKPLRVLALDDLTPDDTFPAERAAVFANAERFGYLPYCTKGNYHSLPLEENP